LKEKVKVRGDDLDSEDIMAYSGINAGDDEKGESENEL
jgi:hypothetical protein